MVVFDNTALSLLLRPNARPPLDPATGAPVEFAQERLAALVQTLQRTRTVVIIPAPVLTELLIKAGAAGPALLDVIQKSSAFRIGAFDTRAAVELAQMTNASLTTRRETREVTAAPWNKIRFDRQIIAIARVHGATAIYSDDEDLISFAEQQGISCVRVEMCRYQNPRVSHSCRSYHHRAMKRKRNPPEAASDQHRRFVETARALECDEDKERFEEKLKRTRR
jgi:predicted nucleic acid-binding protein